MGSAHLTSCRYVLASVVGERDGMSLELAEPSGEPVAEVFLDEVSGERTLTIFGDRALPVETVEALLERARSEL